MAGQFLEIKKKTVGCRSREGKQHPAAAVITMGGIGKRINICIDRIDRFPKHRRLHRRVTRINVDIGRQRRRITESSIA